jgi:glycosyltransferase involved in cell wall biosynthesis
MAVVAFDCPTGPGELVRDGENGILVPDGDVAGLTAGICRLIEDEGLRRHCAAGATETVKAYRSDVIGPMWPSLFDELLGARRDKRGG